MIELLIGRGIHRRDLILFYAGKSCMKPCAVISATRALRTGTRLSRYKTLRYSQVLTEWFSRQSRRGQHVEIFAAKPLNTTIDIHERLKPTTILIYTRVGYLRECTVHILQLLEQVMHERCHTGNSDVLLNLESSTLDFDFPLVKSLAHHNNNRVSDHICVLQFPP